MKNKQLKAFLVGLTVSLFVIVSFFTGALADRLFVLKPVDFVLNKSQFRSKKEVDPGFAATSLGKMMEGGEYSVADVAQKASESVVTVSIKKQERVFGSSGQGIFSPFDWFGLQMPGRGELEEIQRDIGTGFAVQSGLIVTNRHVVADAQASYLVIDKEGKEHQVTNIYRDPTVDLAILQVKDFSAEALPLGNSDEIRVGEPVIAIGTALGQFRHTVTAGVISGLGRGITASDGLTQVESLEGMIQTDAAINPGNSGGPLISSQGQVIGVNVATARAENISFAIPINVVKASIENFNQTGKFERPFLGVQYQTISERAALANEVPQGAYLVEVVPNSSADQAGLEVGDIITKFAGQSLKEPENDLAKLINQKKINDEVAVEYWRDGEEKTTQLKLSGRPE